MDLTPIFRKEFFLDAIIKGTTPPEPIFREEYFLAKIAGADVVTPTPIYRIEKYLAKIGGDDVEIPDPVFREEYWLAKKCGENVTTPTPVFRLEYFLEEWVNGSAPAYQTLTGKIVSFLTQRIAPLKIEADLTPIQSGSGDPSPENIRPISGHTGAEVWDDPAYGGTIMWNQMFDGTGTRTSDGITTEYDSTNKAIKITNDSRTSNYSSGSTRASAIDSIELVTGHKYAYWFYPEVTGVVLIYSNNNTPLTSIFEYDTTTWISPRITKDYDFVTAHPIGDVTEVQLCFFDLTEMFGAGNEPSTFEAFRALFPKNYYDPQTTPVETCVSAVNGDPYEHATISFGTTVYGGTLTVNEDGTGSVVADVKEKVFSAFDMWTTITGFSFGRLIISDIKSSGGTNATDYITSMLPTNPDVVVYATRRNDTTMYFYFPESTTREEAETLLNGMQIVYPLATPITIPLTPGQVEALQGQNVVWVDSSDEIKVTYRSN